jgi:hypothetical protein
LPHWGQVVSDMLSSEIQRVSLIFQALQIL